MRWLLWFTRQARLVAVIRGLRRQVTDLRAERDANADHVQALREALKSKTEQAAEQYAALRVDYLEAQVRLAVLESERPDLLVQLGRLSNELFTAKAGAHAVD